MKWQSIVMPEVGFAPRLNYENIFAKAFGSLTQDEWTQTLIDSIDTRTIDGVSFPTFPPAETQNRIHGHDNATSIIEAAAFYDFACRHNIAGPNAKWFGTGYVLDYGAGWGRIVRPFMRDFPLKHIIGYEPGGEFVTVARAHNPYVTFLSGGYMPDGILPPDRFDLAIGWSVYSHLSEVATIAWLKETARILRVGGAAMYTTWGMRFLERLKVEEEQMRAGEDIHWYSRVCLLGAGDINQRISDYQDGKFVWFDSLDNPLYGETFISQTALQNLINAHQLPLKISVFDTETLDQDVFILERG